MPKKKLRASGGAAAQPRLRVLAGPNGSGKSTIKTELRPEWIGVFVNADEIEKRLKASSGCLALADFGLAGPPAEVLGRLSAHIRRSDFARELGLHRLIEQMSVDHLSQLTVPGLIDSYVASVLADAIRRELLEQGQTFTFETVMSSRDKVDFMAEARQRGYRVYLYFVATDDPAINIDRVRRRVKQGGHPVPPKKVRDRYKRSIALMSEACSVSNRAYIFDNSGSKHQLLAQVVESTELNIASATLPAWFVATDLWQAFND